MELKDLQYFVAVAEASGFRRAALHLDVRPSVVSRRIRELEDHLGVSLFERSQAGARLTCAGRSFLDDVRRVFVQLDAAVRSVSAAGLAGEGFLRVGIVASISTGFPNLLIREWCRDHPRVTLDIVEGAPNEHVAAIIERRLDLTFVAGTPYSNGCDVERLWDEPIFAALPSGHQFATRELIDLRELARERFIVSGAAPGPEIHNFIIKRLSELGSSPCIRYFGVGRETLMAMVGLTLGVSLVSGAEIGVSYPGVTFVQVTGESLPFSAIWSPDNDNPALRSFLSKARIRARRTANLS